VEEKFEPLDEGKVNDVHEVSGNHENFLYLGRLPCQAPEVDGTAVIISPRLLELGTKVPCQIVSRSGFDLKVRLVH
jgi:hypothetical protein